MTGGERMEERRMSGYVWCYSHKRWERADDLIDFPCSDTFLDAYYELGLTPRHSPNYYNRTEVCPHCEIYERRIKELEEENRRLKWKIYELRKETGKSPKTIDL